MGCNGRCALAHRLHQGNAEAFVKRDQHQSRRRGVHAGEALRRQRTEIDHAPPQAAGFDLAFPATGFPADTTGQHQVMACQPGRHREPKSLDETRQVLARLPGADEEKERPRMGKRHGLGHGGRTQRCDADARARVPAQDAGARVFGNGDDAVRLAHRQGHEGGVGEPIEGPHGAWRHAPNQVVYGHDRRQVAQRQRQVMARRPEHMRPVRLCPARELEIGAEEAAQAWAALAPLPVAFRAFEGDAKGRAEVRLLHRPIQVDEEFALGGQTGQQFAGVNAHAGMRMSQWPTVHRDPQGHAGALCQRCATQDYRHPHLAQCL